MADGQKNLQININAKDNASKSFESMGKKVQQSFNKISAASGVALAGLTAFAGGALSNFADLGEELHNMSLSTGVGTEALSGMKIAADSMGLSMETVTGSIKKMQVNLKGMSGDTKKANEALQPLGLTFKDLQNLKPEEQLFALGNKISAIEDPAKRTALAVQMFGKSGVDLLPFFNEGSASLEDFTKKAQEMGLSMDDLTASKAAALDDAMDSLKGSLAGVTQQIATALAPVVTQLVKDVTPVITQVTEWIIQNKDLVAQIAAVTAGALLLGSVLAPLTAAVTALGTVLAFVAANPVVILVAALATLVAMLVDLYNKNEEFRNIVNEVWANIQVSIDSAISGIKSGIKTGMDVITGIWNAAWQGMANIVNGITSAIETSVNNVVGAINRAVSSARAAINSVSAGVSSTVGVTDKIGNFFNLNNYIPKAASGGVFSGSKSGFPAILHGTEAVVPLPDGRSIPVKMEGGGANVQVTFGDVHIAKEVDGERFLQKIKDTITRSVQLKTIGSS